MALRMNMDEKVTVITGAGNIIKACDYLGVKYIKHEIFSQRDIILKQTKCRAELHRLIKVIDNQELHFSHTQFAVFCFLLVDLAMKHGNKVVYHNFELLYKRLDHLPFISVKNYLLGIRYFLIKALYNAPLQLGRAAPGIIMICLHTNFLEDKRITNLENRDTYFTETIKLFQSIKLPEAPINVLFIAQTFVGSEFFDDSKIKEVISLLDNPSIHIKMHPKLRTEDLFRKCIQLPDFLPVEFFFNQCRHLVISFHSASLITASKFDHLKVISLLDIVGKKNDFITKARDGLLVNSSLKIIFPSSIMEFRNLLVPYLTSE